MENIIKPLIDNGNPYYENGIPEEITKCALCFKQLDIEEKSKYYIPWCISCRTKFIRQQEKEHALQLTENQ